MEKLKNVFGSSLIYMGVITAVFIAVILGLFIVPKYAKAEESLINCGVIIQGSASQPLCQPRKNVMTCLQSASDSDETICADETQTCYFWKSPMSAVCMNNNEEKNLNGI